MDLSGRWRGTAITLALCVCRKKISKLPGRRASGKFDVSMSSELPGFSASECRLNFGIRCAAAFQTFAGLGDTVPRFVLRWDTLGIRRQTLGARKLALLQVRGLVLRGLLQYRFLAE